MTIYGEKSQTNKRKGRNGNTVHANVGILQLILYFCEDVLVNAKWMYFSHFENRVKSIFSPLSVYDHYYTVYL